MSYRSLSVPCVSLSFLRNSSASYAAVYPVSAAELVNISEVVRAMAPWLIPSCTDLSISCPCGSYCPLAVVSYLRAYWCCGRPLWYRFFDHHLFFHNDRLLHYFFHYYRLFYDDRFFNDLHFRRRLVVHDQPQHRKKDQAHSCLCSHRLSPLGSDQAHRSWQNQNERY